MKSQPSQGDAIPRLMKWIQEEIKRLKARLSSLTQRVAVLEAGGGGGGGAVDTVQPGDGIDVDSSDPANPVVSVESGVLQAGDPAGGALSGSYPNPSFAVDMVTQLEFDTAVPGIIAATGYMHPQPIASDTWVVVHNLGYKPAGLLVLDSADTINEPASIIHDSDDQMTLTFLAAFGGVAFVS